ncbi:tetratricopeptide repeat protein [Subsaxibacter sp. CAU 1640]|uniref:tetratricopeptide repeat protein n=1 Tax=Subsaxibacter sp. CAU 1640 TaxID=2933271 RepID=UPI002006D49F|nr:tetratricopeptide repeat protein [Subsaxibacter sp. CAU 1640]MCK7589285.1 tetratricopeptide repeat protein [Subsaxibacter sp. CAU 1640]
MNKLLAFIFLFTSTLLFSQSEQLSDDYFKRGEFEKALIGYQQLYQKNPSNNNYLFQLIKSHQQLKQYDAVQQLLLEKIAINNNPQLLVELGYNYQLQENVASAKKYYDEAFSKIEENPNFVFGIAHQFEDHSLLEEAIRAYKRAMELNPNLNFNIQLAQIYGEQGDVEGMFSNYLDYIETKPAFINNAKRAFSDFVSENKENENNLILKKLLLKNLQSQPHDYWYELLSWMFVQEKDFSKSFVQEKALYRRNPESLSRIIELGVMANEDEQDEAAVEIFSFVLETAQDVDTKLLANQYLLDIEVENAQEKDFSSINKKYLDIFETYGTFEQTLSLQISYGNFLAFYLKQPQEASNFLKKSLKLNISPFQEASVKLKLGDILVLQEKFNEALIYYSQIQANLKNSTISQEARFKVAKTSYYKGDFEWAESQLKILKSSTSQLIANDALDLKLLISDNKYEDSLHVALKLYAKADLMAFQNKTDEAIDLLGKILTEHKGESVEDEALLKQAQLFEKKKQYEKAVTNYKNIIANYSEEILADDALYFLAELYNNHLAEPEKAKELYEQIIFKHEDSIYSVEARKKFRMLRGDAIN